MLTIYSQVTCLRPTPTQESKANEPPSLAETAKLSWDKGMTCHMTESLMAGIWTSKSVSDRRQLRWIPKQLKQPCFKDWAF